jgi:hypothetical protein
MYAVRAHAVATAALMYEREMEVKAKKAEKARIAKAKQAKSKAAKQAARAKAGEEGHGLSAVSPDMKKNRLDVLGISIAPDLTMVRKEPEMMADAVGLKDIDAKLQTTAAEAATAQAAARESKAWKPTAVIRRSIAAQGAAQGAEQAAQPPPEQAAEQTKDDKGGEAGLSSAGGT